LQQQPVPQMLAESLSPPSWLHWPRGLQVELLADGAVQHQQEAAVALEGWLNLSD